MLSMYTWPATPPPILSSLHHPITFSLGSSVSGFSRITSHTHTLGHHCWSLPPNSQNGHRGPARSVERTALVPPDPHGRHSDRQSTETDMQRGRREYSEGFVMTRNVDLNSCFSLDHTALILPSPSPPPLPSLPPPPSSPPSPP